MVVADHFERVVHGVGSISGTGRGGREPLGNIRTDGGYGVESARACACRRSASLRGTLRRPRCASPPSVETVVSTLGGEAQPGVEQPPGRPDRIAMPPDQPGQVVQR